MLPIFECGGEIEQVVKEVSKRLQFWGLNRYVVLSGRINFQLRKNVFGRCQLALFHDSILKPLGFAVHLEASHYPLFRGGEPLHVRFYYITRHLGLGHSSGQPPPSAMAASI